MSNTAINTLNKSETYLMETALVKDQAGNDCFTVKEIWEMIIKNAHATGEPGICFIDRVNRENPTPHLGQIESSNPCGEQYLLPYEACCLGSLNVSKFVNRDRSDLEWSALRKTVQLGVRFLDNVIDANHYPVPEIEEITLDNRKIGLGIMAFADALILLGIRYDNEEAIKFAKNWLRSSNNMPMKQAESLPKKEGNSLIGPSAYGIQNIIGLCVTPAVPPLPLLAL